MSDTDNEKTEVKEVSGDESLYPCLEIISGPKGTGRFPLRKGKNSIGRSDENDIVLDDSSVSRRHAVIEIGEAGVAIADLGSRNGTKVSGQKIAASVPLAHETPLKVGLFQLRFLTGPAAPAKPQEVPPEPEEGLEAELPAVAEEGELPVEVPPEEPPKRFPRWMFYLFLASALVVALFFGGSRALKFFAGKFKTEKPPVEETSRPGEVGGVLPVEKPEIPQTPQGVQPVFLDFSSVPIPAQVFFGDQPMGVTPFRISSSLEMGKWYEARALFQLPEIGEVLEERSQFAFPEGASVIPIAFTGKIGVFKISSLPRDAQIYLEGYFEKDPYRAKPIKFAEIVFGKPVFVPFGRYILELRRSRQLGSSQTFLDEVIYRREFYINLQQTTYTVEIKEEELKIFPVQITSIPPAAKVFVDEKEVGTTPYTGTFPVGEHLLTLKREGYFDFVQMIKMEINMPYVAEIQLKTSEAGDLINKADLLMKENRPTEALPLLVESLNKKPSARETAQISYLIGICYLRQKSYKEAQDYFAKAMAHDDYKFAGRLGIASLAYEQGDTTKALQILVEVLLSSEDPPIRADAGVLFQKISPLKSVMYITSEPAAARVWVNGTEMGQQTPLILHDLGVGSYTVQVRKDGHEPGEVKLNLGVSEFRPVVVKLKKVGG